MKITWELIVGEKDLKKQRRVLEKLLYDYPVSKKDKNEALEGVLSLLEALQDHIDDAKK